MAFTALVPVTMNISMTQGAAQLFTAPTINNAAGTAINLSAWVDLTASIVSPNPGPNTADVSFGTVTGAAAGLLTLEQSATDLATVPTGTAKLIITGKPTSGDIVQLLATGSASVNPG